MNTIAVKNLANLPAADDGAKKAYRKPQLQEFGKVHHLTQGSLNVGNDNPSPLGKNASDPVIKENIVRVGTHPLGFGLYLFDYKPEYRETCGHARQFGVMADEVLKIMPEAVSRHANGYMMVDYMQIGVSLSMQ